MSAVGYPLFAYPTQCIHCNHWITVPALDSVSDMSPELLRANCEVLYYSQGALHVQCPKLPSPPAVIHRGVNAQSTAYQAARLMELTNVTQNLLSKSPPT